MVCAAMKTTRHMALLVVAVALLALAAGVEATPTENLTLQVVPAPGAVVTDGKAGDWDLTAGAFLCANVEQEVNDFALWVHAMYDAERFYLLVRWVDRTPLNNHLDAGAENGWEGDCLQFRLITSEAGGEEMVSHLTAFRGADGKGRLDIVYGRDFNAGHLANADEQGARQAFARFADGRGYTQEIALPWKLLTRSGRPPAAGSRLACTIQGNISDANRARHSIFDVVREGTPADRPSQYNNYANWGLAEFVAKGRGPLPPVRLAGGKTYRVTLAQGAPVIDWDGLVKQETLPGILAAVELTPEKRAEIEALVKGLGAETFAERRAARAKLRALGAAAAPVLEAHLNDDDPEIREQAAETLRGLGGE